MITITLIMRCPDHPGYTGTRRRLTPMCWGCEDIYNLRHPENVYDAEVTIEEVHSA